MTKKPLSPNFKLQVLTLPTLKFMYYLNIEVPQDMVQSWFNLCFLDSLVVILSTEITTVHQAPFRYPLVTQSVAITQITDGLKLGEALDRFHQCCQTYLSLSISRLILVIVHLLTISMLPFPVRKGLFTLHFPLRVTCRIKIRTRAYGILFYQNLLCRVFIIRTT